MRLRLSRRRKANLEPEEALREAAEHLNQTRNRSEEVSKISRDLRVLRERNHFAEKLQFIMEGSR